MTLRLLILTGVLPPNQMFDADVFLSVDRDLFALDMISVDQTIEVLPLRYHRTGGLFGALLVLGCQTRGQRRVFTHKVSSLLISKVGDVNLRVLQMVALLGLESLTDQTLGLCSRSSELSLLLV